MRIAMVSEPATGDDQPELSGLGRALADAGHDVTVFTRRDDQECRDVDVGPGLRVRHLAVGPAAPVAEGEIPHRPELSNLLHRLWRAERPDVVHAHCWTSGVAAAAALSGLAIPLVQTFPALGSVERRRGRRTAAVPDARVTAERVLARRADRLVATSDEDLAELVRLGTPRRRVSVVPHGVDHAEFGPGGRTVRRGVRPRLLCVGRLDPPAGIGDVLGALTRLPDVELIVAGGPATGTPDVDLMRLQGVAAARGVADRVRFVGAVPRPQLPALVRSADVVVDARWYSSAASFPTALIAMACERAVVATAVGGHQDAVVPGVTGLLVSPRRPDALAATLRELLASPTLTAALGVAGRARILSRYTWAKVATATEAVYGEVLTTRPHGPVGVMGP